MEKKKIYLLNGPNLNRLGIREPGTYGTGTLEDVVTLVSETAQKAGFEVEAYQSNHEGDLVDWIHQADASADGIIMNPAAYTHTSVALRDAVSSVSLPVIEIHISNVHAREAFRHTSMLAPVCAGQIVGFGMDGYRLAVEGLIHKLNERGDR
ncbi:MULTISPECIES: type II 3-dehydroquinate dehydratase [Halobacillus]|uniref:type II 3-dehydroquinate dehydratase n=1 Tax=Halobacillus TaxID=45667 RepID=UPI00136A0CE6|nr:MULTISPECIES: type II 3-dehydroquinate dehydratase [Halobacillus]MCA1023004.1 type II 3-dehydroquinate dehydratase [Halobacillus litoralis]MYL28890.1 type II 3-dehydroquinate dehydratase [Halobacillus halophilus]MYL37141.1 type II 3-dehydroquinate dehydratase [Halobacillus litoralis]